ncbi:MAG: GTP cyclohydrolase II [Calditrichaeota bacterium]|nr:GTP cyclohydrolase II [Calditrichota bacterium]
MGADILLKAGTWIWQQRNVLAFWLKNREKEKVLNRSESHPRVWVYAEAHLPTRFGQFRVLVFRNDQDDREHLAVVQGRPEVHSVVPVRVHSECLTSEVLGSLKCDCREQLHAALEYIDRQGYGIVLYLRQEGRGIGLGNKIRAYALQESGLDTVEANHALGFDDDLRRYDIAAAMLHHLHVNRVALLTNNPRKISGLEAFGIEVVHRLPLEIQPHPVNQFYLATKARKSGHLLESFLEEDALTNNS